MERSRQVRRSAVNVCLNNVVKSIKSDHPCSEGYEVENLISNNFSERSKGFLAERFIKPPVTITFEFTSEIDLRYIYLQCNVGAQKTSGIDVSIQPHSNDRLNESVSSGVLKENEKGFVFHRHSENVKTKFGQEVCFRSFRSSHSLSAVKMLRLKIFRTEGSSVPALGKVEIWGVPHKSLPVIENSVIKRQNTTQSYSEKEIKPNGWKLGCDRKSLSSRCEFPQNTIVPEDFIDPITCEIMCQPVTLPSGKIVDISTLESYEKAESQWGRGPSDPFTGIPFTSSSKPVVASDLKARIDKFLCDNSNNPVFHKIPRTVGRSYGSSQKQTVKPSISKLMFSKAQISNDKVGNNSLSTYSNNCINPLKRRKVSENKNKDLKIQLGHTKQENSSQPNSLKSKPNGLSFQERMEKSLELSLKSTLSSLPSFTADNEESNEKTIVECNVCKSCDNLFSIPCHHFICRKCLVHIRMSSELLSCSYCKFNFHCRDVQKVHLSK